MGNQLSTSIPSTSTAGIDSYLEELTNLKYNRSLGNGRFLKTVKADSPTGSVVIKILVKPSVQIPFQEHVKLIIADKEKLRNKSNVFPYQFCLETGKAVYLVREYFNSSLYDRISTRPFLDTVEKKFIAFQLLMGLANSHENGVYHGDLKTENVMVTSWNWIYLADYAPYKPAYLPEDNPSDFTFFFDTAKRRSCYLAPERFYDPTKEPNKVIEGQLALTTPKTNTKFKLNASMDIFSLGCCIAELFVETSPTFLLSQLLSYRRREFDLSQVLQQIDDKDIRNLVNHMVQLDPKNRLSAKTYLELWREKAFPSYFYTSLYPFMVSLVDPDPVEFGLAPNHLELQSDGRILKFDKEFARICQLYRFKITEDTWLVEAKVESKTKEVAVILCSVLTASLRNCIYPSSKVLGLEMLLVLGRYLNDAMKLDRLIPYIVDLVSDKDATVRRQSILTLTSLLNTVGQLTQINVLLFPQYLLPKLRPLLIDTEVMVRCTYAEQISSLAKSAKRFFDIARASDPELLPQDLYQPFLDHVSNLLIDGESAVKRSLLGSIGELCKLFGQQKSNDIFLSHMITYLNDRDWQLRCAFFESIVDVGNFVGGRSLEAYILPLMIQAITDSEPFVVEKVVQSLASLVQLDLFTKLTLWDLIKAIVPLLGHPTIWIRYAAIRFISVTAEKLQLLDQLSILAPAIAPFIKFNPINDFSPLSLAQALATPLNRALFDEVLTWPTTSKVLWNQLHKLLGEVSGKSGVISVQSLSIRDSELWDRFNALSPTSFDVQRVLAMREYLTKVASAINFAKKKSTFDYYDKPHPTQGPIHLTGLGVTPRTEFFYAPPPEGPLSQSTLEDFDILGDFQPLNSYGLSENPNDTKRLSLMSNVSNSSKETVSLPATNTSINNGGLPRRHSDGPTSPTGVKASAQTATTSMTVTSRYDNGNPAGSNDLSTSSHSSRHNPTVLDLATFDTLQAFATNKRLRDLPNDLVDFPKPEASPYQSTHPDNSTVAELPNVSLQRLLRKKEREVFPTPLIGYGPIMSNLPSVANLDHLPLSITAREQAATNGSKLNFNNMNGYRGGWVPKGKLLVQLKEHSGAINVLKVSPDHRFFVSGSDDGTIKVWDAARLDFPGTPKSQLTYYHMGSKVVALTFIKSTYCVAACNDRGDLQILKIEVGCTGTELRDSLSSANNPSHPISSSTNIHTQPLRYLRLQPIHKFKLTQGSILLLEHTQHLDRNWLVLATSDGYLLGLDLKTRKLTFKLHSPPKLGLLTSMLIDPNHSWLVSGTSRGILVVWDLRFLLLLTTHQLPCNSPILQLRPYTLQPSIHDSKLFWVVSGPHHLVTLWDLATMTCTKAISSTEPSPYLLSKIQSKPLSLETDAKLLETSLDLLKIQDSRVLHSTQGQTLTLLPLGSDGVLTAGTDGVIKYYHTDHLSSCHHLLPYNNKFKFMSRKHDSVQILYPTSNTTEPVTNGNSLYRVQDSRHKDAITTIITINFPTKILLSGDRAGVINVMV